MKTYFKDKNNVKAIFTIILYILIFELLSAYVVLPIIEKIFLSIYAPEYNTLKNFNDLYPDTNLVNFVIFRAETIFQVLIYVILAIFTIIPNYQELRLDTRDMRNDTSNFSKQFFVGFAIFYAFVILSNIIVSLFEASGIDTSSQNQAYIEALLNSGSFNLILMVISTCILGPIVEELVYRKAFFTLIKNKHAALIASSFIFGIIHALSTNGDFNHKLIVSIPYIFSGIGFGLIYINSKKNILPVIAVHAFSNFISVILSILVL